MDESNKCAVLVIGGGATGTGLTRDLALRGVNVILVEREDLASGTTGKNHGILHSGARYVVADPPSATECAQENPIISRIARHIVEDFGGYYVLTEEDDPLYRDEFISACRRTGVRIVEVAPQKLLEKEPYLTSRIKRSYRIQDKAIDMFRLCVLNGYDASLRGADVRTYTEVEGFRITNGLIRAVKVRDTLSGEQYEIKADVVVNTAGPWAGIVANMAGEELPLRPGKGTLVVTERRIFNSSAIGHLRYPSDGD
ncbi:glycerol-3-phosphate dehydrogenase, partial [Candidatus Hakubella thermalkaliphila]